MSDQIETIDDPVDYDALCTALEAHCANIDALIAFLEALPSHSPDGAVMITNTTRAVLMKLRGISGREDQGVCNDLATLVRLLR